MRIVALVSALIALCLAAPASAQDVKQWGQVADWDIKIDATLGNGCFAWATYEGDAAVRIGYNARTDRMYLLFGASDWKSLQVGKKYRLHYVFDGRDNFDDDTDAVDIAGTVFLHVDDLNDDFLQSFAERHNMEIFYQGKSILHLSLRNTAAAMAAVVKCQESLPRSMQRGGDPFK